MRGLIAAAAVLTVAINSPASAVVLGQSNVGVGLAPIAFNLPNASFLFSYDAAAAAAFSYMPYSMQTAGSGETSLVFGQPSPFDQRGILIDANLFPSFGSVPSLTAIPYSLVAEDLALRYMVGADYFYGYARLNGNGTLNLAFESLPNVGITAGAAITGPLGGAVPEPSTWAMMLLGVAAMGYSLRARSRQRLAIG